MYIFSNSKKLNLISASLLLSIYGSMSSISYADNITLDLTKIDNTDKKIEETVTTNQDQPKSLILQKEQQQQQQTSLTNNQLETEYSNKSEIKDKVEITQETSNTQTSTGSLIKSTRNTSNNVYSNLDSTHDRFNDDASLNPPVNNNIFPVKATQDLNKRQQEALKAKETSLAQSQINNKNSLINTTEIQAQTDNKAEATANNLSKQAEIKPRAIVLYFSLPEILNKNITSGKANIDEMTGASILEKDNQKYGAVEYLAHNIATLLDVAVVKIAPIEPYSQNHDEIVDISALELDEKRERQVVLNPKINLNDYDTIFLGFPMWWMNLPTPISSFLKQEDLSGKTIIPFCSNSGSNTTEIFAQIKKLEPNAKVQQKGFSINRERLAKDDIKEELSKFLISHGYQIAEIKK